MCAQAFMYGRMHIYIMYVLVIIIAVHLYCVTGDYLMAAVRAVFNLALAGSSEEIKFTWGLRQKAEDGSKTSTKQCLVVH